MNKMLDKTWELIHERAREEGVPTMREMREMAIDEDLRRKDAQARKEREARVKAAGEAAPRPYREGAMFKYGSEPITKHLVECSLYPEPRWWIYDFLTVISVDPIEGSRRELTPEEWDELSPLKL